MFPTIHDYTANDLNTQGFGALSDCISAEVSEELNGGFTLEMTYPLNGIHSEYLIPSNVIMAKPSHNQKVQPFRINQVKKSLSNSIKVYANHISYDLSGYPVKAAGSYNSLADVLTAINSMTWSYGSATYHNFKFMTDMTSSAQFKMEGLQTVRSWMGGQDGSILDTYGGEWVYDTFTCILTSRRGIDTGYRISYGKNLAEYEKQRDNTAYSHVCAYWKKSEVTVYSDLQATNIDCPFRCVYVDASKMYDNQPSVAQLNAYALTQASTISFGTQTITVAPAQLGNNIIGLGDGVLICYDNVFSTRVIKTEWDVLAGEYKSLELGTKKTNITETIKSLSTDMKSEFESTISKRAWGFANTNISTIHYNDIVVNNGVVMGGMKFKFNASGSGWRQLGTVTDLPKNDVTFPLVNLSGATWLGELQVRTDGTVQAFYGSTYANDAFVTIVYDIA